MVHQAQSARSATSAEMDAVVLSTGGLLSGGEGVMRGFLPRRVGFGGCGYRFGERGTRLCDGGLVVVTGCDMRYV